jgi:DNA adenine methylase
MEKVRPFLRWAGGKRWLARSLSPLLAARLVDGGTYFEPFLGSGAMFFAVQPGKAILSDQNEDLVAAFKQVAKHHKAITNRLTRMAATAEEYYRVRRKVPSSEIDRAVRFIYLNRNCYGGLYRENQSGVFNVPFGGGERNHTGLCSNGLLSEASSSLSQTGVELRVSDFGDTLKQARAGDVVYCDPTYREVTRRQFDRYGKNVFLWEDQKRLARLAVEAYNKGAVVVTSNTTCDGIRDLYQKAGVVRVSRPKGLAPSSQHKNLIEYLLILDPLHDWPFWEGLGSLLKPLA